MVTTARRLGTLMATVAIAALMQAIPSPVAQAAYPGEDGRILFVNGDIGSTNIHSAKADASDPLTLTPAAGSYGEPEGSPDGQSIAFENGTEIWVMNADGSDPEQVSPDGVTRRDPSWRPNMTELAWTDGGTLYRFNLATETETPLLQETSLGTDCAGERFASYLQAEWSPLGNRLVALRETDAPATGGCTRPPDPIRDLVLVTPAGVVTELTDDATLDAFPDWAPDGSKIVFNRGTQASGFFGISTIPASGGAPTELTEDDTGTQPVYSPSGDKILYVRDENNDGKFDLWTMNANGTNRQQLIQDSNSNRAPDWFQGGDAIVVNRNGDAEDANTSNDRCDTDTEAAGNQCTLRAAIQEANADADETTIHFNIDGDGVPVITPGSQLPIVEHPVKIDGTSQPGDAVRIVGSSAGSDAIGLRIQGGNSLVKGLQIGSFGGAAIELKQGGNNDIFNNGIGALDNDETLAPNARGVVIDGSNGNDIGSATAGDGNLIRALLPEGTPVPEDPLEGAIGIHVKGGASNNNLRGNKIVSSTLGVAIMGATNTRVGGGNANAGNLFAHNNVAVLAAATQGTPTTGVPITHNPIVSAVAEQGQAAAGVVIAGPVGGADVGRIGDGNIIAGAGVGVFLYKANGVTVEANGLKESAVGGINSPTNNIGIWAYKSNNLDLGTNGGANVIHAKAGIFVQEGQNIDVTDNIITRVTSARQPVGVWVQDASDVLIKETQARKLDLGMTLRRSSDLVVRRGGVFKSTVGLSVVASRDVEVDHLLMHENDLGGSVTNSTNLASDPRWPQNGIDGAHDRFAELVQAESVGRAKDVAALVVGDEEPSPRGIQKSSQVSIVDSRIWDSDLAGLLLSSQSERITVGGPGEDANLIHRNNLTGVVILGGFRQADRIKLARNQIHFNGLGRSFPPVDGLNVDVANDKKPTLFGRPKIREASVEGNTLTIRGRLKGNGNTDYTIDVYGSEGCGANGQAHALEFIGRTDLRTNGQGEGNFRLEGRARGNDVFGALATPDGQNNGSTGELSLCRET